MLKLRPWSWRAPPLRALIMAGALLLALALAAHVVLGPWAAKLSLAAIWLAAAAVFAYVGVQLDDRVPAWPLRPAALALATGFGGVAAATAARADGWATTPVVWILYGVGALGMIGALIVARAAGRTL